MKLRRLSDEELRNGIKMNRIAGGVFFLFGVVSLAFSIRNYYWGFLGLYLMTCSIWLLNDGDFKKIMLEIRQQKNNGVDKK